MAPEVSPPEPRKSSGTCASENCLAGEAGLTGKGRKPAMSAAAIYSSTTCFRRADS